MPPTFASFPALPATTIATIHAMTIALIHGSAGAMARTPLSRMTSLTTTPSTIGTSTVLTMSTIIDPASTCRYDPARNAVSRGVTTGAASVETVATETPRATSPFDRNVMTFDAVPLGAQPTRMSPTASSGERLSACAMIQPAPGMMT